MDILPGYILHNTYGALPQCFHGLKASLGLVFRGNFGLRNTDHLTVYDGGGPLRNPVVRFFLPGYRSSYEDKAQAYKDYSAAFFGAYLKGRDEPLMASKKPSNPFVELWLEKQ